MGVFQHSPSLSKVCILCTPLVNGSDSKAIVPQTRKISATSSSPSPISQTTNQKPREEPSRQLVPSATLRIDSDALGNIDRRSSRKKKSKVDVSPWFKEEIDSYPEDEIKLVLKQTPDFLKDYYNVLNTPLDPFSNLSERTANSYDDDSIEYGTKEESVCHSVIRNIYPREANRANIQVYIPNTQEFMQVIQAEICKNPDQECNYLRDNLPYGMVSLCQQKYGYKKLMYLDPLEKRMASDLFRYPSCCSCHVRISSFDSRSGSNMSSQAMKPSILQSEKNSSHEPLLLVSKNLDDTQENSKQADESKSATLISVTPTSTSATRILQTETTVSPISRAAKRLKPTASTNVFSEEKVFIPDERRK